MSDIENQPDTEPETESVQDPSAEAEKWKALARKHEERAKQNAAKAQQYDELEQAQKSDQERLAEAADQARREADQAKAEAARYRVAVEKGLPSDLIQFLSGTDEESLTSQAETLLSRITPAEPAPNLPRKPVADLRGGSDPTATNENPSDIADRIASKRSTGF